MLNLIVGIALGLLLLIWHVSGGKPDWMTTWVLFSMVIIHSVANYA